ncbi:CPBP family glutamic-type intramembrane protease [uncultured Cardiobacterium sp.]|uniref:CPBP family glutamic-type intramembrane protease n=1 Tax=uncultured Cardiobacterium sp. TaxID=417619 RepID=UPI0026050657|nr:CPBP family glutamic-type intramembrane protease [uncultured Cardiobacterium sp.]
MLHVHVICSPCGLPPAVFYCWSFVIPCACWLVAGFISRSPALAAHTTLQGTLGIIGLAAPAAIAAGLFCRHPALLADLKPRLSLRTIRPRYLLAAVLLGPVTLVLAQLVSLAFGYSAGQFRISGYPGFTSALFSPWLLLVLAPLLEELAWHSYGTDALLARFRLVTANFIFTAYWFVWHLPLVTIKGYYQANLVAAGWQYGVNFLASMACFVFIMNWLYLKNARNIWIAVVFHLCANLGNEIFATHPDSKIIQTGLFFIILARLMGKEKALFFQRPNGNAP